MKAFEFWFSNGRVSPDSLMRVTPGLHPLVPMVCKAMEMKPHLLLSRQEPHSTLSLTLGNPPFL